MKVLMINVMCGIRSTGRICTDLAIALERKGHDVKIAYGREQVPKQYEKYAVKIGNDVDVYLHGIQSRIFDNTGFASTIATRRFIKWIEQYNPDIIHLHNIHGYYINIKLLFEYLKKYQKRVIWTLHDCWSFTGHCSYFTSIDCNKWRTQCENCPQKKEYPASFIFDRSRYNYETKKQLFLGLNDLTIVTPSMWLAELVKESFLKNYPVKVINNGIDISVFKKTMDNDAIRRKYNLHDKVIILGVAAVWNRRKGLDVFLDLRMKLSERYSIVLVGLSEKQIKELPSGIVGITRTNNTQELAALYSLADVFVNPTYEDNYPTTNLEAIACGTPVITFNTGGSPESAVNFGKVVDKNNIEELIEAIKECKSYTCDLSKLYLDKAVSVDRYLELYEK